MAENVVLRSHSSYVNLSIVNNMLHPLVI